MDLIKKAFRKIREGKLKEVIQELLWIYEYGLKYKGSILWHIGLGITGTVMGLTGSVSNGCGKIIFSFVFHFFFSLFLFWIFRFGRLCNKKIRPLN